MASASPSALPASLSAGRFEVGRAAADGRRKSNRSCTLFFAISGRGPQTETFSKTGPAPNDETCPNFPMSPVGAPRICPNPPKAGFGHKAPFFSTGRGAFSFGKTKENGGRIPPAGACCMCKARKQHTSGPFAVIRTRAGWPPRRHSGGTGRSRRPGCCASSSGGT